MHAPVARASGPAGQRLHQRRQPRRARGDDPVRGGPAWRGLPWMVDLTAAVALRALPDVPEPSQRALAAGLVRCEELAGTLGPGAVVASDAVRQALDRVPQAVDWARQFTAGSTVSPKQFQKRSAPNVMTCAVRGLAASGAPDLDARLRALLRYGHRDGPAARAAAGAADSEPGVQADADEDLAPVSSPARLPDAAPGLRQTPVMAILECTNGHGVGDPRAARCPDCGARVRRSAGPDPVARPAPVGADGAGAGGDLPQPRGRVAAGGVGRWWVGPLASGGSLGVAASTLWLVGCIAMGVRVGTQHD